METIDDGSVPASGLHAFLDTSFDALLLMTATVDGVAVLREARRVDRSWQLADVALDLPPSSPAGFARAPDGRIFAGYDTGAAFLDLGEIVLGVRDGAAWSFTPMGIDGPSPVRVGLDEAHEPHLLAGGRRLESTGGGWQSTDLGGFPRGVVLAPDGVAHAVIENVSYSQSDEDQFRWGDLLYVATGPDGEVLAQHVLADSVYESELQGAIGHDARGGVQLCWAANELAVKAPLMLTRVDGRYATTTEVIADPPDGLRVTGCSIAVDAEGAAHVAYMAGDPYDGDAPELRYASNASGVWLDELVRAQAVLASESAVAVGGGAVHVAWLAAEVRAEPRAYGWARRCVP